MNNEPIKDDIVLNDDEPVCILTETRKKATPKELVLQSVIQQMNACPALHYTVAEPHGIRYGKPWYWRSLPLGNQGN